MDEQEPLTAATSIVYRNPLTENGSLVAEEFTCSAEDIAGEKLFAAGKADFSGFSDSEIKILATVKERFDKFTSKQIMERSHYEEGYKNTTRGHFISYKYADMLKVRVICLPGL